jgi:integrase
MGSSKAQNDSHEKPPHGWHRRGHGHEEDPLMPTSSSHSLSGRQRRDVRVPVRWRGQRVSNLWSRRLADGTIVYEFQGRVMGSGPIRRRLQAATPGEAVRAARRVANELEQRGSVAHGSKLTVSEAADRWLDYLRTFVAAAELADSTLELHEQRLRCRIVPKLGHKRLSTLTPADVSRFLAHLRSEKGHGGKPLAGATRSGYLATLEALLTWAVEQRLLTRSPVADLPRRERPTEARQRQPRRLNKEQVLALLSKLGPQFKPIGYVLAFQALRVSEALGLRWRDVDFDKGRLTVSGQLGRRRARVDRTKTPASAATIDLLPAAARELRAWRAKQAERDLNLVRPDALVFTTWNGLPQSRRNVLRAVANAAAAAGLHVNSQPTVTNQDLRGSAGSIALPLLGNLARVSKMLRHKNPNVTSRLYVDVLEGDTRIGADLARAGFGA